MAKKKKKTPEEYRPIIADDPDEDSQGGAESSSLPQNILLIGEHVEGNRNIYISQKTYREIHRFTKGKTTNESGGVLVGQVTDELGRANVMIEGFIVAKHCEATPTTLKFTHETWEQIHADLDRKFPGKKIIGWIHTHPDFGIFLSEYDKFIQENFFSGEDQVAYVIDPIRHTEGFYFWVNGEIERCSGFYIYDEIGTQINAVEEHSEPAPAAKPSNAWKFVCGGMGAVMLVMLLMLISQMSEIRALRENMSTLTSTANSSLDTMHQQIGTIAAILNSILPDDTADTTETTKPGTAESERSHEDESTGTAETPRSHENAVVETAEAQSAAEETPQNSEAVDTPADMTGETGNE